MRGEVGREVNSGCPEGGKWGFTPSIMELWKRGSYWRLLVIRFSCGKNLGSWRLVEEVKMMILEKWQKVFVVGLGKQINSTCHEN